MCGFVYPQEVAAAIVCHLPTHSQRISFRVPLIMRRKKLHQLHKTLDSRRVVFKLVRRVSFCIETLTLYFLAVQCVISSMTK